MFFKIGVTKNGFIIYKMFYFKGCIVVFGFSCFNVKKSVANKMGFKRQMCLTDRKKEKAKNQFGCFSNFCFQFGWFLKKTTAIVSRFKITYHT